MKSAIPARSVLLATTALIGLSFSFAWGQDAPAPQPADDAQEILVTGQRAANIKGISLKAESPIVMDTVAADEAGQLPDFNAGDVLKRIPGVNVLPYQGEPRYVTIRGFDTNYDTVNIDGFAMASPYDPSDTSGGGRQVYVDVLPSNIAQHFDVYKSGSPDIDGHAVGGVINMVTPGGFDYPDNALTYSIKGGYNLGGSQTGGATPIGEAQLSYATRFGTANQYANLVSASYWLRDIHVPQEETEAAENWYNSNGKLATTPYGGNGIAVPSGRLWYNYQDNRDRYGVSDRFDWQPTDAFQGHASIFYYRQHESADRNDLNDTVNSTSLDLNQTPTSGELTSTAQYAQLAHLEFTRQMYGFNGENSYRFDNDMVAELRGSFSRADLNNPQVFSKFTQNNLAFSYDTAGSMPVFTPVNPAQANNYSLYGLTQVQFEDWREDENVFDVQANLSKNSDAKDQGFGFKTGLRYIETVQHDSYTQTTYQPAGATAPYSLANAFSGSYLCGLSCNNNGVPLLSQSALYQEFDQNKANLTTAKTANTDLASDLGGDYGVVEDISSVYAMIVYSSDLFHVQGGLRDEYTDFTSTGFGVTENKSGTITGFSPLTGKRTYNNPLPSVNLTVNTSDISLLRLGLSDTIGRPRYSDMATHGGVLVTSGSLDTQSEGNPDLKPRFSQNLDLSNEIYLDDHRGLISIDGFAKKIHDEIFTTGQMQDLPVNGVTTPVLVTQAQNSSHVATVYGSEFNVVHDLDFLPAPFNGFGVSANALLSWTYFPVTLADGTVVNRKELPEQANRVFNAALYYVGEKIHGRIAWNYTGHMWDDRYPNFTGISTYYENRDFLPVSHVDLQVSYQVAESLSIDFSALNITGAGVQENDGLQKEIGRQWIGFSPSVMLGVSGKF